MILGKVNYNYFRLYKASSLNLKMIWSRRVSFFVFLRCRIFMGQSHGYSEKWFHLLLLIWMDENWSLFLIYKSCPEKVTHLLQLILNKSRHKPLNTMDLQREILIALKVTRPSFFWGGGYHPPLKLSGIPTFTFIVNLTHRVDNI